jgi:hypothetical protein
MPAQVQHDRLARPHRGGSSTAGGGRAHCGEHTLGRLALFSHLGSLFLAFVALLAGSFTAFAEPPPPPAASPNSTQPSERVSLWEAFESDDAEDFWTRDELELAPPRSSILLPPSKLPIASRDQLLGQVTLVRRLPGTQVVRYRGLQGFVVKRLRRVYRSRWRRSLRDAERAGGLDHFQLAAHYRAMAEAEADLAAGGRWWERSWLHSLPAHKGGAPTTTHQTQIGGQVEVFRIGPLSFTNDFRARIHGVGFRIAPDPGRVFRDLAEDELARDHATLRREAGDEDREDLDALPNRNRSPELEGHERRQGYAPDEKLATSDLLGLSLDASVPDPGLAWKFHVRPEARVRLRAGSNPRARVGVRGVVEISMGPPRARKRVIDVIGRVRYDLVRRDLVATLQIQLVAW